MTKPADSPDFRIAPAWSLGLLAGGRGSRMGRDKATAPFMEGTMAEHVVQRLAPLGVPVLVSVRTEGSVPMRDGWRAVPDVGPAEGPLAGMAALLAAATTKFVLVVPCDMLLLPSDLGDRMVSLARGADGVVFKVGGRNEPFPALIATDAAAVLAALRDRGERRADAWHDEMPACHVPFEAAYPDLDPARALFNANDPEAALRAEAALREEGGESGGAGLARRGAR